MVMAAPPATVAPPVVQRIQRAMSEQEGVPATIQAAEAAEAPALPVTRPGEKAQPGPEGGTASFAEAETVIAPRPAQPLPLEAVWPVRERDAGPAAPPAGARMTTGASLPFVQRQTIQPEPTGEEVHTLLRGVQPGQPTASAVELVLPRRPRPNLPVAAEPPGVALDASVQREAEASPAPPVMVPTEIGPLPSDLWTLLGQTPPASEPGDAFAGPPITSSPSVDSGRPAADSGRSAESVMRAIAEAERPSASAPQVTAEAPGQRLPLSRVSQPQVSAAAPPAIQREPGPDETAEAGEAEAEAGVDVDKLARQVYAEVRRRLASEWERGRGQR
jgi:hypothetical protein